MRDPLNNLEHIKIKPLSETERSDVWIRIKSKLATTPVESPFSLSALFSSKALAYAFAFLVVFGTVGASNNAVPGSLLFPLDLAVERVESSIDPASRADHARERLNEFDSAVGVTETVADSAGADIRMQENAAPEAEVTTMMAFSVSDDVAQKSAPAHELSPEMQEVVENTRRELLKIEAEATLKGDAETLAEIQTTIAEFEARVNAL
jgi:hypothetical protein